MRDEDKSQEELIRELIASRQRIIQLESQIGENAQSPPLLDTTKNKETILRPFIEHSQRDSLRVLIDSLPDFIAIKDKAGRFIVANLALARHMGVATPEDLIGKTDFDFFPEKIAKDYYDDEQNIIKTGKASINQEDVNYYGHHKTPKYLLSTKIPLKNEVNQIIGTVSIIRDITQRKQAEKVLEARESYLRTLMDSLADAVFTVEMPERRIAYANQALETIFGYKFEEIVGQQTRVLYPNDASFISFGKKLSLSIEQGQSQLITEHVLSRKNGESFWASIAQTFLYSNDELVQVISIVRDISERKKLEHDLQESKQYLSNILEFSINAIIAIDSEHKILTYNKGAEQIFGHSPVEILGQALDILIPSRYRDKHKSYMEKFSHSPSHARRMNERGEIYGRRRDGSEFPAEASISKFVQDGKQFYTVMLQDISEKKRLEAEANIYHAAVEASSEMIVVLDRNYTYIAVNRVYLHYLGIEREKILGTHIAKILGEDFFSSAVKQRFDRCLLGEIQDFETQYNFPVMGERILLTNYSPLYDDVGEIKGIVAIIRDITEQRRAEEQAFAYRLEQEKVKMLADFIRDASHEFRTPLTVIQSSLYLLNKTDDIERRKLKSAQIEVQIKRMARLVKQLITMSRVSSDVQASYRKTDVNRLIQNLLAESHIANDIAKKAHSIEQDLALLPLIMANPNDLSEAIGQILDNAIYFSPPNKVIAIQTRPENNGIVIEIRDSGEGISEKDMPHIFDRFYRADKAHTTSGFGLGLPIAKAIIEQHQGTIAVIPKGVSDTGICVRVWLAI